MNIVTIDPSLTSTAVIVNGSPMAFCAKTTAETSTGAKSKWFKIVEPVCDIYVHQFKKVDGYAESELQKLGDYTSHAAKIVERIRLTLPTDFTYFNTKIFIEGYSYSSAAGPLIDLVTFGTLLRNQLCEGITNDITVVAPTELKMWAGKLTYPALIEKKKTVYRNKEGVIGGQFKKPEMYKALIENPNLSDPWVDMLRANAAEALAKKAVPKPIEDINDAKLMYEIALSNKY